MRILQIAGTFPPGPCGIGDYAARLAEALARSGDADVGVLTQRGAGTAVSAGVEVMCEADHWRMRELPRILRRIRKWKPDLVHLHYPSQGFGLRIAPIVLPIVCKLLGLRVVQTWHEPWSLLDAHRFLLQRAGADGLVFVRPNYQSLLPRALRPFMRSCAQRTIGSAGALPASALSDEDRARLRSRYLAGRQRLVVFFGFVYPAKGVEQLFDIADPATHALVIAGPLPDAAYLERLKACAADRGWSEQLVYTGYVTKHEAADLIAAADAVVLPFHAGGGDWNTSIHGALAQGTLVITTSTQPRGDDPVRNLYTAPIARIEEMRRALHSLAGRRVATPASNAWADIARLHAAFYRELLHL